MKILLLLLPVLFSPQDDEWHTVDAAKPEAFKTTFSEPGYIWFEAEKVPARYNIQYRITGPGYDKPAVLPQARVLKGEYTIQPFPRWGGSFEGKMRVRVHFSAESDPGEPDSAAKPRAVKLDTPFTMALMPLGDLDWPAFDVPGAGYIEFTHGELPEAAKLQLSFGREGVREGAAGWHGAFRVPGAAKVRTFVRERWHARSSPQAFEATIKYHPEFDFLEPNDTPAQAAEIGIGEWHQIAIATPGDSDFVAIEVPGPGYLAVQVDGMPERLTFQARRVDETGAALTAPDLVFAVTSGRQLIQIYEQWGNSRLAPFLVRFRFIPEFDELRTLEGNLIFGQTYRTGFLPTGDRDAVPLVLDEPGVLNVSFRDLPPRIEPTVRVLQGDEVIWTGGAHLPVRLPAGTFTYELSERWKRWSLKPFGVRLDFLPEPDAHEPNGAPETATPLALNTPVEVQIYPLLDVDLFRVEIPSEGLLQLIASGYDLGKGPGMLIDVTAEDGVTVVARTNQTRTAAARVVRLKAGTYLIRIHGGNYWAAFDPFLFEANFRPDDGAPPPPEIAGNLGIAVVGLNLPDEAKSEFDVVAHTSRVVYVETEDEKSLDEGLKTAVDRVVEATEKSDATARSSPSTPGDQSSGGAVGGMIIGALAALGMIAAIGFIVKRKAGSRS